MPPLSKQQKFELLTATFALVEERGPTPLTEIAAHLGIDVGTLRDLIDPLLFLEYRTPTDIVDMSRAFLLDEAGVLRIDEGHWLRNLRSVPPSDDDALRLLLAAEVVAAEITSSPALTSARAKLAELLGAPVTVEATAPPEVRLAQQAILSGRSLRCRYLGHEDDTARDRELLGHLVFHRWGRWYLAATDAADATGPADPGPGGPPDGEGDAGPATPAVKYFRFERMSQVRLGDLRYTPRDDVRPPEWFRIDRPTTRLRVRTVPTVIEYLTVPHVCSTLRDLGDGRVEAELVVVGDRMLDQMLVALGPTTEIVEPAELRERRRTWAAELAARIC